MRRHSSGDSDVYNDGDGDGDVCSGADVAIDNDADSDMGNVANRTPLTKDPVRTKPLGSRGKLLKSSTSAYRSP